MSAQATIFDLRGLVTRQLRGRHRREVHHRWRTREGRTAAHALLVAARSDVVGLIQNRARTIDVGPADYAITSGALDATRGTPQQDRGSTEVQHTFLHTQVSYNH